MKAQIYLAKILDILKVDKRNVETCLATFRKFYTFGKYNGRLFKNNRSNDQEASAIVKNSRKREQELFERKSKYELEKHLKHVEARLEKRQDLKYEGQEIWLLVIRKMKR